ncbi:MAG: Asp-tRNA(Asn)/Glu-tRNA(Gln) amidotransferase GatCAB subunit C [Treponemataceae bacterium]
MELKFDKEIFEDLLYISRLNVAENERTDFMEQIKNVVSGMDVLRNYLKESATECKTISETDLRSSEIVKGTETKDLKKNSEEFLDGYYRVPKVLE